MAETLPRLLDIRAFVEARAAEVSTLLAGLQAVKGPDKFGAPALPRHLRRRATSHQRRWRLRRPNLRLAAGSSKRRKVQPTTPAAGPSNTETMHMQATEGLNRPTNRSMRRRPARMWSTALHQPCAELQIASSMPAPHDSSMDMQVDVEGLPCPVPQPLPAAAATQVRRLESHTWHARRMRMHGPLWGHQLALQLPGKGRGSRSFLHQMRTRCVMHDASYWGCLQLSGHQQHIHQVLQSCSDVQELAELMCQSEVVSGAVEWQLCLLTHNMYPSGAISPVRGLWVPGPSHQQQQQQGAASPSAAIGVSTESAAANGDWYEQCMLWLWVHPAAFQQAADALHQACVQLSLKDKVIMTNLSQLLARIELVGGACDAAMRATVQPHLTASSSVGSQLWHSVCCMEQQQQQGTAAGQAGDPRHHTMAPSTMDMAGAPQASIHIRPPGQATWEWPDGCVVGVTALDPRLASPVRVGSMQHEVMALPGAHFGTPAVKQPPQHSAARLCSMLRAWPDSGDWTDSAQQLFQLCAAVGSVQASALKGSSNSSTKPSIQLLYPAPLSDASIAKLRQQARTAALHLPAAQPAASTGPSTCPVLLVRRQYGATPGWSLIMPAGWVLPFWLQLAFQGARPAGQLEWRWVAAQAAVPSVPWDYPYTQAWHYTMKQVAAVQAAWALRRPAGRLQKPPCLLPYIPWERIGKAVAGSCSLHQCWSHAHMGLLPPSGGSNLSQQQQQQQQQQLGGQGRHMQGGLQQQQQGNSAATASASGNVDNSGQALPQHEHVVHVLVRLVGKGKCQEGAELSWSNVAAKRGASKEQQGLHVHDACTVGPLHERVVLGYVTTACPKGTGTSGYSHVGPSSVYPGGLGVVRGKELNLALAQSGRPCAYGKRRLLVHLQNPGTDVLRLASLVVL